MQSTISHLAGPVINIKGRVLQRCSICGEKLTDTKNQQVILNVDGTLPERGSWWPPGFWVRTRANGSQRVVNQCYTADMPKDNCLILVEEV